MRAVRRGADRSDSVLWSLREEQCDDVHTQHAARDGRAAVVLITLGHPLVDAYLEFVGARGAVNTWLATAYDLKVFFEVVGQEPAGVTSADVFAFLAAAARTSARERGADRGR